MNKFTVSSILFMVWGFLFTLAGISFATDERQIEKMFEVSPGGKLILNSDIGAIRVTPSDQPRVDIKVDLTFRNWKDKDIQDFMDSFQVDFDQTADGVSVTARLKKKWMKWGDMPNVEFMIQVPRRYHLDLTTAGGSISVDDLEGELLARTSGGSMQLGKIIGPVDVKTSGGSIQLQDCRGDAELKTSGGSITVGQVEGAVDAQTSGGSITLDHVKGSATAKTSGGSITVKEVTGEITAKTSGGSVSAYISEQPQSDCVLETSGGTVTVYMAPQLAVTLDAKTSWGKVKSDFEVLVQGSQEDHALQGKINGGGPQLYLRTSGGNIKLLKK